MKFGPFGPSYSKLFQGADGKMIVRLEEAACTQIFTKKSRVYRKFVLLTVFDCHQREGLSF